MKLFRVIGPGPRTTFQDSGRRHFQRHGLAQGGAADRYAYLCANKLLDNDLNASCLELTMGGLRLEALADMSVAITGADCNATVNGSTSLPWQNFNLKPGDQLSFSAPKSGRYTYLAVRGGFQSKEQFGSRSVIVREFIDDLTAVAEGNILYGLPHSSCAPRSMPQRTIPSYEGTLRLKAIPAYQHSRFSASDRARFVTTTYRVSARSDRMGYQLENGALRSPPSGIISEGIALGAIQVPGDGNPVVLLQDRQTIGGYPKIGTVCSVDCYKLAQARPGQAVEFEWTDIAEAHANKILFERSFTHSRWSSTDTLKWV